MAYTDIIRVRKMIGDDYGDNYVKNEDISGQCNGNQTLFFVSAYEPRVGKVLTPDPLATYSGYLNVYLNGVQQNPQNVNYYTGGFTLSAAPAAGSLLQASYYFLRNSDDDITALLGEGFNFINGDQGLNSIDTAPGQLQTAAVCYTAYLAFKKMASRAAELAEKHIGDVSANLVSLAQQWSKLGDDRVKEAYNIRNDYYARSGQREAPAITTGQFARDSHLYQPQF